MESVRNELRLISTTQSYAGSLSHKKAEFAQNSAFLAIHQISLSFHWFCIRNISKWILFVNMIVKHDAIQMIDFMLEYNRRQPF